jgi:hypothetical protein
MGVKVLQLFLAPSIEKVWRSGGYVLGILTDRGFFFHISFGLSLRNMAKCNGAVVAATVWERNGVEHCSCLLFK